MFKKGKGEANYSPGWAREAGMPSRHRKGSCTTLLSIRASLQQSVLHKEETFSIA